MLQKPIQKHCNSKQQYHINTLALDCSFPFQRERERVGGGGGGGEGREGRETEREGGGDRERLFVCWLVAYRPSNMPVYLRHSIY